MVNCPKCYNPCKEPEGARWQLYFVVCLISFGIGYFTEIPVIYGAIGPAILVIYDVFLKNKEMKCPKCGYTWTR